MRASELKIPQDDGGRDHLEGFWNHRDEVAAVIMDVLCNSGQHWNARVFLEMLWELEDYKRAH